MSSSLYSRQPEFPAADDGLTFESRSSAPTVVVKRRRLAGPERPAAAAVGTAGAEGSPTTRRPKVFRVDPPAAERPAPVAEPAPAPPQGAPVRRKRDPLRAPVLLRHEVLAPPPPPPAAEAPAEADYRAVCAALDDLRRDIAFAQQARRFKLPLI